MDEGEEGGAAQSAFEALGKDAPDPDTFEVTPHTRVRHDKGRRVLVLVCDLDIRVLSEEGELLRHLTLDPDRDSQPLGAAP